MDLPTVDQYNLLVAVVE